MLRLFYALKSLEITSILGNFKFAHKLYNENTTNCILILYKDLHLRNRSAKE